jgi:hypothetical protein
MTNKNISGLDAATTPLAGTELVPVWDGVGTKKVTVVNLTAGRDVAMKDLTATGNTTLGDSSTDTLNVGNGGIVKDSTGRTGIGLNPTVRNNTTLQIVDGIGFPATMVASTDVNTLDDYREGTFTPTMDGTTDPGVGTYSTQTGTYVRVGRLVNFTIALVWSAHTGTGGLQISGLPFTLSGNNCPVSIFSSGVTFSAGYSLMAFVSGTSVAIRQNNTGSTALVPMDTAGQFYVSGTYEAA